EVRGRRNRTLPIAGVCIHFHCGRSDSDVESEEAGGTRGLNGCGKDALRDDAREGSELILRDGRVERDVIRPEDRRRDQKNQKSREMNSLLSRNPEGVNATREPSRRSHPSLTP